MYVTVSFMAYDIFEKFLIKDFLSNNKVTAT